ncbi:hypothetical protein Zmor_010944 [Zophobas morio]|uniref:Uncharacterized protein n=1 Tax=Zophobas morio TaxID=2755281 RepID=A0AA38MKG1_9CUCU|nr:hypothetical protein Zmor_010944 [Zophobas morio]
MVYKSTEDTEKSLTIINDSLMSGYEKSCSLEKEGLGKGTPWWNRRLSVLQSGLRKLFSRAKNAKKCEDWEAYKEHRKEFKKEETENVKIFAAT